MAGEKEKKSSDTSRFGVKRSGKLASRSSKLTSTTISAPPKAAVASPKAKKDDVQRRKNPFNEMLLGKSGKEKDTSSSAPSTVDDNDPPPEHARSSSRGSQSTHEPQASDRIGELERALEASKKEQAALREELEKVRQHGQVYRETIEDYRRQLSDTYSHQLQSPPGAFHPSPQPTSPVLHSPLPRSPSKDYQHESRHRQSFNKQREDLLEQNYELRSQVAELQDQLMSQNSLYHAKLEQEAQGEQEWNEMSARLHQSEKESQERLQQLLALKSSISSLTRVDSQVTDSELSEAFSQLANRVREWAISNFRRTKLDLSNLPPETIKVLETIYPGYSQIDPTDRLALYQALISNSMMHIFNETIAVGLPEVGPLAAFKQLASYIRDAGPAYHEWCRATMRTLEKSEARHSLQEEKQKLLHRLAGEIEHQLFTLTSINLTPNAQSGLWSILNTAADLQHKVLLQKAQYKLHFFRNHQDHDTYFDQDRMESINDFGDETDDDGDVFIDRKFAFCVFPCLEKFGDEWGEHSDVSNILLKARVCCGVG
ncbi:hypothetical protein BS50DRAFT_586331 [Corynespora cassiicola Philippines]|uniref:Uncharacterized protein n=1 Tax=Corynespora cassiicola Philippines TaxID=1448308 RepID=A0A2T2NUB1_CORCC|nr:hypothetical protein BS50DRAFT_586331 [Corynespora cassiicola Philippines]